MSAPALQAMACVDAGNTLGEGIVWCERAQALYWTDIRGARCSAGIRPARWTLADAGAAGLVRIVREDGWLLLALASRLAFFRLATATAPPCTTSSRAATRSNDGGCDRQGRFVFGTLHEPARGRSTGRKLLAPRCPSQAGAIDLPGVAISNSIAFSPDGGTMYFCDSPTRQIHWCDYGDELGRPRLFVELDGERGEPDGSCVDADGCLWNAQWGRAAWRATAPMAAASCVAVGGAATYAASFRRCGAGHAVRHQCPRRLVRGLARRATPGAVFAVAAVVRGMREPRFAGVPGESDEPPLDTPEWHHCLQPTTSSRRTIDCVLKFGAHHEHHCSSVISRPKATAVFTCVLAALAGLMFGLDIGVISGATQFIQEEFQVTDHMIEWIVSSMMFGAAVGALGAGWMSAALGRKRSLISARCCSSPARCCAAAPGRRRR